MKTTYVLSLDEDTAAFLETLQKDTDYEDPTVLVNRLLRQERDRLGMTAGMRSGENT